MRSQKALSAKEQQMSLIYKVISKKSVNNFTVNYNSQIVYNSQLQIYQCYVSGNSKALDRLSASDSLLKDIKQVLKKHNKRYKTEIECMIVDPTFKTNYRNKLKRFVISNSKRNRDNNTRNLQKVDNKKQIKLSRLVQPNKELNTVYQPLISLLDRNSVGKLNLVLSKKLITTLDNNNILLTTEIAGLLTYLCRHSNNDEFKRTDNVNRTHVPVITESDKNIESSGTEHINKVEDNKISKKYAKIDENINCVNDPLLLNIVKKKKQGRKIFRTRIISRKLKLKKTRASGNVRKTSRQKGTNTYINKKLKSVPCTTTKKKLSGRKCKSTNTTIPENDYKFPDQPLCENCMVLENLNDCIPLKTNFKNKEQYKYLRNNNTRLQKVKSKRNFVKNIIKKFNLPKMHQKIRNSGFIYFPLRKKFKSNTENCNQNLLYNCPPNSNRNEIIFSSAKETVIPINNTNPIISSSAKVQTDENELDCICTKEDKKQTKIKRKKLLPRNFASNTNIHKKCELNKDFLKKLKHYCKIFKLESKRNLVNAKISTSPSDSVEQDRQQDKYIFINKNKGIKLTIGRVAEDIKRSKLATPLDFNHLNDEIDLTDNIRYQSACYTPHLPITAKLEYLPSSTTLTKSTTRHCFTKNFVIDNSSIFYNSPKYGDDIIPFNRIVNWKYMLSGTQMYCCQPHYEFKYRKNGCYFQENVCCQSKYIQTNLSDAIISHKNRIKKKTYFEWLNFQEQMYLIESSHNFLWTYTLANNNIQRERKCSILTEPKFCWYLLNYCDGCKYNSSKNIIFEDAPEYDRIYPLLHPQSKHTCCISDSCDTSYMPNYESCDICSEVVPKCTACTSSEIQWREMANKKKYRRKLGKNSIMETKYDNNVTTNESILPSDNKTSLKRKHVAIWSKLNQKFTKKSNKSEKPQTELFLGVRSNEEHEPCKDQEKELTFSDFEKMSERQLRNIISQLSKAISPCKGDESNSDDTGVEPSCSEESNLNCRRQGIKLFIQPNDLYSNKKLLRFFYNKKKSKSKCS